LAEQAVRRFEDLVAWQKARELTKAVYVATREGSFARDFGLASQMQRSAVSVMANIAEGFERRGPHEFSRFLVISKASCAEVASHLYIALDAGYVDTPTFDRLLEQAREVGRVIGGLLASVDRRMNAPHLGLGTRASEL
jgi:four helix bundle protein